MSDAHDRKTRFMELRSRVHMLWSRLTVALVDDVPVDVGFALADDVLNDLDVLFLECLDAAHRGCPSICLDRATQLVRMKRHVHGLVDRYIREITGGLAIVSRERLSRTDVADSRALLEHARMRHREALAS